MTSAQKQDVNPLQTNFSWLIRLRWVAIAAQGTIIVLAQWLWRDLNIVPLLILLGALTASNFLLALWKKRKPSLAAWMLAALMGFDFCLLTLLLTLAGGASNPFSVLYLVDIALAAVVLRERVAWGLALLAIACFGLLFYLPSMLLPEHSLAHNHQMGDMHLHYEGMWLAFVVAAVAIVYFVTRVTRDLEKQRAITSKARSTALRNARLASLATLAAGAAHELSTPLSTIAIVTKELERQNLSDEIREDILLIREEVARCRNILNQMASDAGENTGEAFSATSAETLIEEIKADLQDGERVKIILQPTGQPLACYAPLRALAQIVRGLIKNALEASAPEALVSVTVTEQARWLIITIVDTGVGMDAEVLSHIGEPFWSTKEAGQGMGLGVFLAKNTLDKLGGQLLIDSTVAKGTTVTIKLPVNQRTYVL